MIPHTGFAWLDAVLQVIGYIGFPASVCIYLLYLQNSTIKDVSEVLQEFRTFLKGYKCPFIQDNSPK